MSIASRLHLTLRVKTHAALDQLEDPDQTFDYAQRQQEELLRKVGEGLIEVATARQRLSRQAENQHKHVTALEGQARRALDADREDLARTALERKQSALSELADLDRQIAEVMDEKRSLTEAYWQLARRVETFRHQRAVAAARLQSAVARVKVGEALTGVSGELAELSMAVGRAGENTERLQARASAIDTLITSGVLSTPIGRVDEVELELREIASEQGVEEEITAMRAAKEAASATLRAE